jgi:hypothetical protein
MESNDRFSSIKTTTCFIPSSAGMIGLLPDLDFRNRDWS